MAKIKSDLSSLAGEYAVASELCRREIYAQLTLGNRKKTDLLLQTDTGMLAIEVKTKQGRDWLCEGISGDSILVLVDYQRKTLSQRPDFYILTAVDWKTWLNKEVARRKAKRTVFNVDKDNCPHRITTDGTKESGISVSVDEDIQKYAEDEDWSKMKTALRLVTMKTADK